MTIDDIKLCPFCDTTMVIKLVHSTPWLLDCPNEASHYNFQLDVEPDYNPIGQKAWAWLNQDGSISAVNIICDGYQLCWHFSALEGTQHTTLHKRRDIGSELSFDGIISVQWSEQAIRDKIKTLLVFS